MSLRAHLLVLASALAGCATGTPSARSLHEVDGEIVYSRPPSPGAYEAYLRARLALDDNPPRPEDALVDLERLTRAAPYDPHLWATRAEAHAELGDDAAARDAANRALALDPGHRKAKRVLASLPGASAAAKADTGATRQ